MHFCTDELIALTAGIPFLGIAWRWFRSKFHRPISEEKKASVS
jgi:hypothetical protein